MIPFHDSPWEHRSPYSVGQISDDTECARELAISIIENGGSFRVGHFGDRLAATHGDTQRRVYREPNGHTVPPHEDPGATFAELAAWVLRVAR